MGQEPQKPDNCKCSTVTARTWLIVFNSIFLILGLATAAAGGILRFGKELVSDYLEDMLEQVETDGDSIADIINTCAIVLMLVGIVLMGFGIIGCCGGCCMVRCCLTIYSMVMIKLLVAEVTLVIVWFVMRNEIEDRVKSALQTAVDTFYAGDTGTDAVSAGFNFLFVELDCCGIDNYTDLYTASNWNRTYSNVTLTTPLMCCSEVSSYPPTSLPSNYDCAATPNATTSNYGTGCYDAFFDYISAYQIALIVIGVCLVLCELFSAVSAVVLNKQARARETQVANAPPTPVKKTRMVEQQNRNNMGF